MRKNLLLSLIFTLSTLLLLITCSSPTVQTNSAEGAVHEVVEENVILLEYGLAVDSFSIESHLVKRNKNLSHILLPHGVTPKTIDIISKMKEIFDVRKIRSGNPYKLFFAKDTANKQPQYFAYEHSLTEYVVIKLTDSVEMWTGEKPTTIEKKMASGNIKSNLWDAMIENSINPMMSIELSEIYAWSIDFFDLKEGDQFYVIYEERFLDTISAGIERIHAALFNHQNKDFYAIYFMQDAQGSYFDKNGNSLRREFLKAPLKYSRISSRFSKSRYHPVLKIRRPHSGIDYAAPAGTPVYSVGDGFVLKKGYQKKGAGNFIKIKHNSVYTTQYAHLKMFAKGLKTGDHVKQGQLIGYVGSSGYSTGPHLDFRFFKNGKAVDPLKVDAPPVEPVKKINRDEFERIRDEFMQTLDRERIQYLASSKSP